MPVFKEGEGQAPVWSELEMFEIIDVKPQQTCEIPFRGPRERYVCVAGNVRISNAGEVTAMNRQDILDIPAGATVMLGSEDGGKIVRLCGSWGDDLGGTGIFPVYKAQNPENPGDPADYARNASFDNHYHDCDEYWIVYAGSGRAASEGKLFEVGPGDCIATGRGHHHDFPFVYEDIAAVFFETTMVGQKRIGHLWNHKHGQANPDMQRV